MKLTKREREIVTALVAGSRLTRLYEMCCNTYRITPAPASGASEWVKNATLKRMKASGILRMGDVGGRTGYLPTDEAVRTASGEAGEGGADGKAQ